ncbi:dihydrofolate reductase family protein [Streptomyces sp. SBT349]|uniref:dihydrofolate reductase family protein n=1 Tax=Streptomyces sp. SBT349 TaxID=1580539 RepID=UPI001F2C2AF1|nr:dihydrofolate reductase family protein [Streptomyces sp. SBT349]
MGGEAIHDWAMGRRTDADVKVLDDAVADSGAVVMGRRLFDIVDGPHGWSDDVGYGGVRDQSSPPPYFVVTHRPPATRRLSGDFTFVTGGVAEAVERARAAAGDGNVVVMGGASVCDQCVAAGLADELRIHVAPVLLGGGTRLFDHLGTGTVPLEALDVITTPSATHLFYRVIR